jgi:hypothetical protein
MRWKRETQNEAKPRRSRAARLRPRPESWRADADGEPVDLNPANWSLAGVPIPGINDDFGGKAPDIGPREVK